MQGQDFKRKLRSDCLKKRKIIMGFASIWTMNKSDYTVQDNLSSVIIRKGLQLSLTLFLIMIIQRVY